MLSMDHRNFKKMCSAAIRPLCGIPKQYPHAYSQCPAAATTAPYHV